jgi:DNA polymerase-1
MALDGIAIDVMIADYLLLPNFPDHELSGIAVRRLGYALPEAGVNKVKWESSGQGTMDFDGTVAMDEAVLEEACAILVLAEPLEKELKEKGLYELFTGLEMPLISVIGGMENEGVGIDIEHMEKTSVELDEKIRLSTAKIYDMAGGEFNINSPKQLQRILFDELKLPVMKKTKTGASTDESVLSQLAPLNALPALILEHRALTKLKTTYYDAILRMVDRKTGRLHTTFNQAVAATGRLSSSDPNLQNIPVKTELGREIRKAFISPRKDEVLIAADYSQIELRVLAHLSGDKNLIKAFNKDEDIHKFTASLIFDVALDAVTDKMRSSAKTVNFGILYGMGAFSLSKDLEISVDEAQKFIDSYFERYEGVKKFIDSTLEKARKDGYVTTILGRRRDIPEISSPNIQVKGFAERAAMNTPVQGSAADIIKLAMLGCSRELKNAVMILQVHDELIFSCRKKDVSHASGEIRKRMESVMELKVPLKVDVEWGKNWLEMADVS